MRHITLACLGIALILGVAPAEAGVDAPARLDSGRLGTAVRLGHDLGIAPVQPDLADFGPDGDFLYCLTDRHYSPSYSDFDGTWIYANATQIAVIPLREDIPSPLGPRSDEEEQPAGDDGGETEEESDFILAVNGLEIDTHRNPWAAFQGLAGQTVELTVNDSPSLDGARTVLVETLRSEAELRYHAWIEEKRRRVAEASDGRIGYAYVPDTGIRGQSELVRQFHAQFTKDGLVVDERFNAGGQWPDRFVELLNRPRTGYVHLRHGQDPPLSGRSRLGPTVMLVNSWAGSGGDAFPYLFRRAGIGPIIGTRTWGGLVGISGGYPLVDGGGVTVPTLALYTPEGEWMLEGHGLEPDIVVVNDPASLARGEDRQLERAIEEVLDRLESDPIPVHEAPEPGDRTGPWTGWSK